VETIGLNPLLVPIGAFLYIPKGAINRWKSLLYVCHLQHGQSETCALSYQCWTKKTDKLCISF